MAEKGVIDVATCQFGITANVRRNAGIIGLRPHRSASAVRAANT